LGFPRQLAPNWPQKWATAISEGELPSSLWKSHRFMVGEAMAITAMPQPRGVVAIRNVLEL